MLRIGVVFMLGSTLCIPCVSLKAQDTIAASRESSFAYKPLNDLYQNQWITTNEQGALVGNVVELLGDNIASVNGADVKLLQNGAQIGSVKTSSSGNFSFPNIPTGQYALVVRGNETFAACAVTVLQGETGKHLPRGIELRSVSRSNSWIESILKNQSTPFTSNPSAVRPQADPIADQRAFAGTHMIAANNGELRGRLSVPQNLGNDLSRVTAFVVRDGRELARSAVNSQGEFLFENLPPGCYGLVAAGAPGFAAVSFCLIEGKMAAKPAGGVHYVAAMQAGAPSLNVELAPASSVGPALSPVVGTPTSEVIVEETFPPAPMMAGGGFGVPAGGGFYGGGGSGGGGPGFNFGGLLGAAGLAGVAWAISESDDDDDDPVVVSPLTN